MAVRAATQIAGQVTRPAGHPRRSWSYSAGEWGKSRVRTYDRGHKGLYIEFYEDTPAGPQRKRLALGTTDRKAAKAKADMLALEFRMRAQEKGPTLTLQTLFDIYERSVVPSKAPSTQKRDKVRLAMFAKYFGAHRQPKTLSLQDWNRFIAERRRGAVRPEGSPHPKTSPHSKEPQRSVGNRAIEADLRLLLAVLNFATVASDGAGNPLMDRNPLKGLRIPKEESPKRPTLTAVEYAALQRVAAEVHPTFAVLLTIAHETGHRGASIRSLRWSDVDLDQKRVRWRASGDKMKFEHTTPLSDEAVRALAAHRRVQATIGDTWVFTSPVMGDQPCSRECLRRWWDRAVTKANLPKVRGRGLHSVRRQFSSELKHLNLKDLAALGGWKTPATLLACYITPDEETQREGLATRKPFRAAVQA